MSAYAILIGTKDGVREAVLIGDPHTVKAAFKEAVATESDFDSLEVIDTRQGRTKRKTFRAFVPPPPKPARESAKQKREREKREAEEEEERKRLEAEGSGSEVGDPPVEEEGEDDIAFELDSPNVPTD